MHDQNITSSLDYLAGSIRTGISGYESSLPASDAADQAVYDLITETRHGNPWFIPEHVKNALHQLADEIGYMEGMLSNPDRIKYHSIGVLYRTEAPLAGIAEHIYLAASGCTLHVSFRKESRDYISKVSRLLDTVPFIKERIIFTGENEGSMAGFRNSEAIIAFSRVNETLAAYLQRFPLLSLHAKGQSLLIKGTEDETRLAAIAEQVCMYFGRSPKNARVLFIPQSFDISSLADYFERYSDQLFHNKYFNNFEYRKATFLINQIPHEVIPPVIVTEDILQAGYTGVLCVRRYDNAGDLTGSNILQDYPLSVANTVEAGSDPLRLSTIKENIENISRFIWQE